MVKGLVLGILVGILLVMGVAYFYFATGRAPAAVTDPPMPFEKKLAHMALNAHIAREKIPESPVAADEKNYLGGVDVYKDYCAICHGCRISRRLRPPWECTRRRRSYSMALVCLTIQRRKLIGRQRMASG